MSRRLRRPVAGAPAPDRAQVPARALIAGRALAPARARRSAVIGCLAAALAGAGTLTAGCSATGQGAAHSAAPGARTSSPRAAQARQQRRIPPIGIIGSYQVAERTVRLTEGPHTGPGGEVGPRVLPTLVRFPAGRTVDGATAAPGTTPAASPGTGSADTVSPGAGSPGTANRPASGPYPLVVFAPGYLQCGGVYRHLLRAWASAGYVVAVVRFPRTNCDLGARADEADLVNQPADVSYVISRLLAISARGGALSGLIDRTRIAVAGHSDGGDTVAAVAANTCCADHRIAAAIVLAGAQWPPLRGTYFPPDSPATLFVQGSADPINPPGESLRLYRADRASPRYYLDVFGAGHLTPYEGDTAQERLVAVVTTEFLDRYVARQRAARAPWVRLRGARRLAVLVSNGRLPPG